MISELGAAPTRATDAVRLGDSPTWTGTHNFKNAVTATYFATTANPNGGFVAFDRTSSINHFSQFYRNNNITYLYDDAVGNTAQYTNTGAWTFNFAVTITGGLANGTVINGAALAGTDNSTKITTSASVNAILTSLAALTSGATGSVKIPGTALTLKWTTLTANASGVAAWTFAAAFPTACVFAIAETISTSTTAVSGASLSAAPTNSAASFQCTQITGGTTGSVSAFTGSVLAFAVGY